MRDIKDLRVAIVHDWLYGGGAERVVEQLHLMFPDAPIYTSYCTDEWRDKLDGKVITGYLQHWPFSRFRKFLPLLRQIWFRHLRLKHYDLVISSSGNGEAKFVRVKKPALHVCYCHTPTHFYWRKYQEYLTNPGMKPKWLTRLGLRILVTPLRKRDYKAAQKVGKFIANSMHIQADIKTYYNRGSVVIHPPVDVKEFALASHDVQRNGFVTAGRLVPYKRFDIIVEACTELHMPLTVIGDGPELDHLQQMAGPTVKFLGYVTREVMAEEFQRAEGFIFAAEEDFGITPVEAMAAGTPVLAYKAGGALDYVIPGQTGEFFSSQNYETLVDALKKFDSSVYSSAVVQKNALNFSPEVFQASLAEFLVKLTSELSQ